MDKIKHTGTMNAVCPWCGREVADSWELWHPESECECNQCGRLFKATRIVTVEFDTEKVEA
jgi:hypothetical protein